MKSRGKKTTTTAIHLGEIDENSSKWAQLFEPGQQKALAKLGAITTTVYAVVPENARKKTVVVEGPSGMHYKIPVRKNLQPGATFPVQILKAVPEEQQTEAYQVSLAKMAEQTKPKRPNMLIKVPPVPVVTHIPVAKAWALGTAPCPTSGCTAPMSMSISSGTYNSWKCNRCGSSNKGERWYCGIHHKNICFSCQPRVAMRLKMKVTGGPHKGQVFKEYPLTGAFQISIGNNEECDIVLGEDQDISGTHASICWNWDDDNLLTFDDQESTNGSKVNGKSVKAGETIVLKSNDTIEVGESVLVVVMDTQSETKQSETTQSETTPPLYVKTPSGAVLTVTIPKDLSPGDMFEIDEFGVTQPALIKWKLGVDQNVCTSRLITSSVAYTMTAGSMFRTTTNLHKSIGHTRYVYILKEISFFSTSLSFSLSLAEMGASTSHLLLCFSFFFSA